MAPSEIWIVALVTATPHAQHITTRRLSSIVGSWIILTVRPHSRSITLQFPLLIRWCAIALVPTCHSTFPAICCVTVCLKCMSTNILVAWTFCWYIQSRGLNFHGKRFVLNRALNYSSGLGGSEREHSSDYFTGSRAGKSVSPPRDMDKPDGSQVLVPNSDLCNM